MARAWRHLRDTRRPVCFDYQVQGVDGVTRPVMVIAAVSPVGDGLIVEGLVQPLGLPCTNNRPPDRPEVSRRPTGLPAMAFPRLPPVPAAKEATRSAVQAGVASTHAVLVSVPPGPGQRERVVAGG